MRVQFCLYLNKDYLLKSYLIYKEGNVLAFFSIEQRRNEYWKAVSLGTC